jgi:hypothetical protein
MTLEMADSALSGLSTEQNHPHSKTMNVWLILHDTITSHLLFCSIPPSSLATGIACGKMNRKYPKVQFNLLGWVTDRPDTHVTAGEGGGLEQGEVGDDAKL